MSDESPTPEERVQFETMWGVGGFWLLVGPRGSGKTTFAADVIYAAHKYYPHFVSFTNILLKKKVLDPDGKETFEEYYPKGTHKVTSLSEVFHLLPDILEQKKNVLLVVDEALQSEGFASGQSVLSADVRAVRSFASILRKLRITVILIAQSWRMVASSYRNADFITGILRRQWDGQLSPGYGRKEVLQVIGPRGYEMKNDKLIIYPEYTFLVHTVPIGFGKSSDFAELGDVVFDTTSPAQFGMGLYRKTGKRFNLFAAVNSISVIEEKVVEALRFHLDNPPTPTGVGKSPPRDGVPDVDEADVEPEPEEGGGTSRRLNDDERQEIKFRVAAGESVRKIARDMELSPGTVGYYVRRQRDLLGG